ncbi:porin family protein [Nonlabens spongiae]|uniref:outer membrane beta-barrel protein n=1 Tax=Nonlabens spongiae TaxID=331648 RepID=UPI00146A2958|nr:outer membrane beta-barrel protein [Nonlabens spongiae]
MKTNNFFQIIILALMLSASMICYCQNDNKNSNLPPKTFPIGLRVGLHNDFFSNTNENDFIELEYKDRLTFIAGFDVELFRTRQWLFTTGFFVKNISQSKSYNITADQLGRERGTNAEFIESPYWTYHLPVEALYRFNKSTKHPLYFKGGLELQHYGYTPGRYRHPFLSVNGIPRTIGEYEEYQSPFTFGANLGLAGDIYLNDNSKFRIALTGHYHFQTMEETFITTTNLAVPGATSKHEWTGHYINLSLTYFPKKGFIRF